MTKKCLIISDSEQITSEILKLVDDGWLPFILTVQHESLEIMSGFHVGLGGVSEASLLSSLPVYNDPDIIIIDDVFYSAAPSVCWPNALAISYKSLVAGSDLYLIDIALSILTWEAKRLGTCNDGCCLVSNISSSMRNSLCQKCQNVLPQNLTVSLLSLMTLKDLGNNESSKYITENIGMFLRSHTLNAETAAVKVSIGNFIIDYIIDSNKNVRDFLEKCGTHVKNSKEGFKQSYNHLKKPLPEYPTFIAARRWNSWTPNLPGDDDVGGKKLGGGYLVSDGFSKIAIDPGYGFLGMLAIHGITIMDVDAIVITHDHPDHIAEIQNILSLRYEFRDACKKLKLYLNGSTFYLYQRLASYYVDVLDGQANRVKAGDTLIVGSIHIKTCKMYHKEIYDYLSPEMKRKVGSSASLGLSITGSREGKLFNFAILGDTSFPKDSIELDKIASFYGKPDIAAIHLGSIEPQWDTHIKASEVHYGDGKHLGINGAIKSIILLQPNVAVITEFGEEHARFDDRISIVAIIKEACNTLTSAVIPSDAALNLVLTEYGVLAKCKCDKFVHTKNLEFNISKDKSIEYSFPSGCESGLSHYDL
jgi:L-ascorbate metabolism protein UlaG (beta-lactamase superfamily)